MTQRQTSNQQQQQQQQQQQCDQARAAVNTRILSFVLLVTLFNYTCRTNLEYGESCKHHHQQQQVQHPPPRKQSTVYQRCVIVMSAGTTGCCAFCRALAASRCIIQLVHAKLMNSAAVGRLTSCCWCLLVCLSACKHTSPRVMTHGTGAQAHPGACQHLTCLAALPCPALPCPALPCLLATSCPGAHADLQLDAEQYGTASGLYFLGFGLLMLPLTFITVRQRSGRSWWFGTQVRGGVCIEQQLLQQLAQLLGR
jgi:hypothetical protein